MLEAGHSGKDGFERRMQRSPGVIKARAGHLHGDRESYDQNAPAWSAGK